MKTTTLLGALGISACAFLPALATASATFQIVAGSGEFQTLETTIAVVSPTALTMQWTTDQIGATGGTWVITNVTAGNKIVASGEAGAAPAPGHFTRFTLPSNTFLAAATNSTVKYNLTIVPHAASNVPLGATSPAVVVAQVPNSPTGPIIFGPNAVFPKLEVVTYNEQIGVVPQTQLHYAYADVTVKVSNKGSGTTDPMWLGLKDNNVLMNQTSAKAAIPALAAGASTTVTLRMDAMLPPGTSQLPEDAQYSQWNKQYANLCGVDLRGVLDWRGPVANAPMNDHQESLLAKSGWTDYATMSPNQAICNGKQCISACQMSKNIRNELNGNVVGYSFFAGQNPNKFYAGGKARTSAEAAAVDYASSTKMTVASVSKMVTAIAAVRLLDSKNISVDSAIGPYLPADWSNAPAYIKSLTFAQLLTHTSGIKDYGNVPNTYAQLKTFFTQSIPVGVSTSCQPAKVKNPANPINPGDMTPCYSNYNFALFRVLMPKIAGFVEDANQGTRPQTLANQYIQLVQQNVFNPVGQFGVDCRPPASSNYAFAYKAPGSSKGSDFGDVSLVCGAAGWYLSVEDISKVLLSLNSRDGKILTANASKDLWKIMGTRGFGWDVVSNGELEKNGGWSTNCDANGNNCNLISTSIAVFGPVTGPRVIGVLFLNSDINGGTSSGLGAQGVLEKAYNAALYNLP